MADIFISYASEDRSRAETIAKALEDQGWSVWWDRTIPPGKTFDQVIEEAITTASCVVVLWSKKSIKSDWVKEESTIGKKRKILVPAKIESIEPPIGFSMIQTADLTDWKAETSHAGFQKLLSAISDLVVHPPLDAQPEDRKPSLLRRMLLLYLPGSRKGWILHVPFYILFGLIILLWFVVLMAAVINKYDPPPRYDIPMLTFIFISVLAFILLISLQRFASEVGHIESKEE